MFRKSYLIIFIKVYISVLKIYNIDIYIKVLKCKIWELWYCWSRVSFCLFLHLILSLICTLKTFPINFLKMFQDRCHFISPRSVWFIRVIWHSLRLKHQMDNTVRLLTLLLNTSSGQRDVFQINVQFAFFVHIKIFIQVLLRSKSWHFLCVISSGCLKFHCANNDDEWGWHCRLCWHRSAAGRRIVCAHVKSDLNTYTRMIWTLVWRQYLRKLGAKNSRSSSFILSDSL